MIPNVVTYTTLIGGFCQVGRLKTALELLHEMHGCGQHPYVQTYAILLDGMCNNLHFPEAMVLFQVMEDKKLDLDIVVYNVLINDMCNVGKITPTRELFNNSSYQRFAT
jgi:pentatricopeptide repeat protein